MVSAVIGKGGAVIKGMRQRTQATIKFSEQDEIFPDTDCRVLIVAADTEDAIRDVSSHVIAKVAECADAKPGEDIGAPGELKLRTVMPRAAVGGIIGKQGAAVKALREQSGAKIVISEATEPGLGAEQIITIIGDEASLECVMDEVCNKVQALSNEPWFLDWVNINYGAIDSRGSGKGAGRNGDRGHSDRGVTERGRVDHGHVDKGYGEKGHGDRGYGDRGFGDRAGGYTDRGFGDRGFVDRVYDDNAHNVISSPPLVNPRQMRAPITYEAPLMPRMDAGLDLLMSVAQSMPSYVMEDNRGFALSCVIPNPLVGGLIGRGGSGTKEVQQQTGATVTIRDIPDNPDSQSLNITGPLPNACAAYMLMMRRYLDSEAAGAGVVRGGRR